LRLQVGLLPWNEYFGHSQEVMTAGASYDIWKGSNDGRVALYVDQAGYFRNHSPYRWVGGGIEYRQPLSVEGGLMPYIGAGVGAYRIDLHDDLHSMVTRLGGKVFLGFESRSGLFLEAAYNILGHLQQNVPNHERDLSRASLSVGFRF